MKKENKYNHVGRPTKEEVNKYNKKKNIKIIGFIISVLVFAAGIYLYVNREFIDFSSLLGNSSTYYKNIHKMQSNSSLYRITFNPDKKIKKNGSLFFLEYKHPNNQNIFTYIYKKAGFDTSKIAKDKVEVYYNGKLIKTFKNNADYFYVKQNWAGKTLVLKVIAKQNVNGEITNASKFVRMYIPSLLKLDTIKYKNKKYTGKYYYITKNAYNFYKYVNENKFYQSADKDSWSDSCLGFSMVYANAIKKKKFSLIEDQYGLVNNNDPYLYGINGFERYTNNDKTKVLKKIYQQLEKNNPVVLQVSSNPEGTSRHYIVVIGYKVDFDVNNIKETDLLVLDVWDGDAEIMSGKGGISGVGDESYFMIKGTDTQSSYPDQDRNYGYEIYYMY